MAKRGGRGRLRVRVTATLTVMTSTSTLVTSSPLLPTSQYTTSQYPELGAMYLVEGEYVEYFNSPSIQMTLAHTSISFTSNCLLYSSELYVCNKVIK